MVAKVSELEANHGFNAKSGEYEDLTAAGIIDPVKVTRSALRNAASCLALGTGDLLVEGRLLEFEARVRREQGRSGEAAALLKMAAARYRETGESELLAKVVAARNEILRNEPARSA